MPLKLHTRRRNDPDPATGKRRLAKFRPVDGRQRLAWHIAVPETDALGTAGKEARRGESPSKRLLTLEAPRPASPRRSRLRPSRTSGTTKWSTPPASRAAGLHGDVLVASMVRFCQLQRDRNDSRPDRLPATRRSTHRIAVTRPASCSWPADRPNTPALGAVRGPGLAWRIGTSTESSPPADDDGAAGLGSARASFSPVARSWRRPTLPV